MRIVVITDRFGDVGTHPQLSRIALHMRERGHDVLAVSLAPTGTLADMLAESGIRTSVLDATQPGSFLPIVVRLAALFRRWHPDTVIAFLFASIIPARLAGRPGGVPTVITSIRNEYFGPRYKELVMRATDPLTAMTVVNSKVVADSLTRRRIVREGRITVIPNGVDVSLYQTSPETRRSTRQALGVTRDEFVWLTAGRFTYQKDYPNLLRAFSDLSNSAPRSRLLVLGRGHLQSEVEDLVHRWGLRERVSLLGFRNDVPALLAAADAFVMASRWEGLPNAVMEALAAGRPVVGTDVGGMPELIEEGVNGYLAPSRQPDSLASAMLKVEQATAKERGEMGERGLALVRERYDLGAVMDSWTRLIEVTSGHRARH